jgi:hypothetical protein
MRTHLGIIALLLALLLTGCAHTSPRPARSLATPTMTPLAPVITAQVLRLVEFNVAPAFSATIADPVKARNVYQALRTLEVDSGAAPSCPLDEGAEYRITFQDGSATVLTAWVKPDGCRDAKIGASSLVYATTEQFWQTFAIALGVSLNALVDLSYHGGPAAPTPGPNDW